MRIAVIVLAYILDLILKDPYHWPHPVKIMGDFITFFQRKSDFQSQKPDQQERLGIRLIRSLTILTISVTFIILKLSEFIAPWLLFVVEVYLSYTCLSAGGLALEARKVQQALKDKGLAGGRQQVSQIVGRQTDQLSQAEIIKATVETVAENTSDGFVAPLFYLLILGPIGGLIYKAINTMDSMVGYQNQKYLYFGKWPAKLDDWANWLPARITAGLIVISAYILNLDSTNSWKVMRRDHGNHLSPNAGYPEAAVAGALGLRLGGPSHYHDQLIEKPWIGESLNEFELKHISQVNQILFVTAALSILIVILLGGFFLW